MTHCLDPEAVILINRRHVEATGEPFGVLDHHGLLGALARPLLGFGGDFPFRTPVHQAGALLEGLAQAHPFMQGNKRTAWSAATTYLGLHGISIHANDDEATGLVLETVEGKHDADGVALWFADRMSI